MGVTVGFHRLLTHRAFKTHKPVEYGFAVARLDGPPGRRARLGRRPPQAPRPHRPGGRSALPARRPRRGPQRPLARPHRLAVRDARPGGLEEVRQGALRGPEHEAHQPPLPAVGAARRCWSRPSLGFVLHGFTLEGALRGLIWGGLVRVFFLHHITWSINSVCHYFGRRRFDIEDHSTNVAWLALPSLGEAWHHNHHAFPRSAAHGLSWCEIDLSAMIIGGMRRSAWPGTSCASRPSARRRRCASRAGRASGGAPAERRRPSRSSGRVQRHRSRRRLRREQRCIEGSGIEVAAPRRTSGGAMVCALYISWMFKCKSPVVAV